MVLSDRVGQSHQQSLPNHQRSFVSSPRVRVVVFGLLLLPFLVGRASSQIDPAAGILPFSTQVSGPIDSVDIATGNIMIKIPVRSKSGAIPFSYSLVSNSHASIRTITAPPPGQSETIIQVGTGFKGQPMNLFGAYLQYTTFETEYCDNGTDTVYHVSIVDSTGATHPTNAQWDSQNPGCVGNPTNAVATDGSGYTVNFTSKYVWNIYDRAGNEVSDTLAYMSDPDGNQITSAYLGTSPQTIGFNDTLLPAPSTQYVLVATPYAYPHGSTPDTYEYADANNNTQTVQVNYSSYYVQTNFGCYYKELSNPTTYLPSSINVPDEGTYTITYESTPGYTGDVTGRIAKITLPSGGYVAYQYSGGSNNAGFDCYNRVPTLQRTVSDNNGNVATWT